MTDMRGDELAEHTLTQKDTCVRGFDNNKAQRITTGRLVTL